MNQVVRFISIIVLLPSFFAGCTLYRTVSNGTVPSANLSPVIEPQKSIEEITTEYQEQLAVIIADYQGGGTAKDIQSQLLELIVPSQYLDLHFNLVSALEQLIQATKQEDKTQIDAATVAIDTYIEQIDW